MSKLGNRKRRLPPSAEPELDAILEAERLALEQVLEAADSDLREVLEIERLKLEDWKKREPIDWKKLEPDWQKLTGWL